MSDQTGERKLLLFSVGPVACCADSLSIHRIIAPPEQLVHLPGRTHHPSIFRNDSRLVSVLDVRALFGLKVDPEQESREKLIIAEIEGGLYGFWVDSVETIISEQEGTWRLLPRVVPRTLFDAAFNFKEQLVLHMDFNQLIHARAVPWVHGSGLYSLHEVSDRGADEIRQQPKAESETELDKKTIEKNKPVLISGSKPIPTQQRPSSEHEKVRPPKPAHIARRPVEKPLISSPPAIADQPSAGRKGTEASKARVTMVAPYRPERPVIPDRPNPAEENISYAYETGQSESPVVTFMIWLLLLGVSLGLVLYFLWPTARTQAEKDTDLVVKTPVRESTIIDVIEESVITESIPSESPRDDMQETIEGDDMIEDVAIEEVAIEEASIKEWPAPLFKEVIEPTQPPYASIERQGNVVTITLREAETQQDVSEISTLDYASVNDAGSDVDGQAVATTEMAGQEGELAEPESLSEMRGMETPEPDTQEDASRPGPEPRVVADTASRLDMPPLPPMTAREITHIVVKGDTLWDIALRYIHDPFRYPELARLSNIKNPDLIYPGDRVRILIIRH